MTLAQKENIKRFKAVQAEAKKLKSKNAKLKHTDAVKQAWAILYNKKSKTKKVGAVKKIVKKQLSMFDKPIKIKKPTKQTGKTNIVIDKRKQAMLPGKRVSINNKVYYENRANRSDKGRLLGVKNVKKEISISNSLLTDLRETQKRIANLELQEVNHKLAIKNKENSMYHSMLKKQLNDIKKYLKELKEHNKELKKLI